MSKTNRTNKSARAAATPPRAASHAKTSAAPKKNAGGVNPTFSFRYADRQYVGAWKWPGPDEAHLIFEFLCDMGQLTWIEIHQQITGPAHKRRPKHHFEDLGGLCSEAQGRFTHLGLDDLCDDQLFRFRLGGGERLWGFIKEEVFYVVWWDSVHGVRPQKKRAGS